MSSEEKEFRLAKRDDVVNDIFSFDGLELNLNSGQALLRQRWKLFIEWRYTQEQKVNRYTKANMQETDELIAEMLKMQLISSDKNLFSYLLTRYSVSGAKAKMVQINSIMEAFKAYLKQVGREKK